MIDEAAQDDTHGCQLEDFGLGRHPFAVVNSDHRYAILHIDHPHELDAEDLSGEKPADIVEVLFSAECPERLMPIIQGAILVMVDSNDPNAWRHAIKLKVLFHSGVLTPPTRVVQHTLFGYMDGSEIQGYRGLTEEEVRRSGFRLPSNNRIGGFVSGAEIAEVLVRKRERQTSIGIVASKPVRAAILRLLLAQNDIERRRK